MQSDCPDTAVSPRGKHPSRASLCPSSSCSRAEKVAKALAAAGDAFYSSLELRTVIRMTRTTRRRYKDSYIVALYCICYALGQVSRAHIIGSRLATQERLVTMPVHSNVSLQTASTSGGSGVQDSRPVPFGTADGWFEYRMWTYEAAFAAKSRENGHVAASSDPLQSGAVTILQTPNPLAKV